jgi:hypothetical protein
MLGNQSRVRRAHRIASFRMCPPSIAAWREAGGSHISVVTMDANLNTVDGHIDAIKRWRDVYNSVR